MKKILLGLLILGWLSSSAQIVLRKDQLNAINTRDIKSSGAYSSLKLGKLIDSLILSLNSQRRAAGYLPVGNSSGIATDVPLSGDGTLSNAGVLSVTKISGNTFPSNASGVLTNNGSGGLSWGPAGTTYTADESTLHLSSTQFSIKSTYIGQSSITTLGTIGTGVWNGTAIGDSYISSASIWNAKQSAITFGTGVQSALGVNIGSSGAPVLFNGAGGTPSILTLTNATGLPISGITGLASGIGTWLANPSSSNLYSALTTKTGNSSNVVFSDTPTLTTPVLNGLPTGTGVSSSATASTLVARDVNANLSTVNSLVSSTSTATAAGTTTLTVASARDQHFTGSTTQTCVLPVASTLTTNQEFWIYNDATGIVTVTTSGSNTLVAMAAGSILHVICINPSGGTGLASWSYPYYPPSPLTTIGGIIAASTTAVGSYYAPTSINPGTAGYVLTSNGAGALPTYQPGGGLSGLTTNQVMIATSSTTIGGNSDLVYGPRSLTIGLNSSGTNTLLFGSSSDGITSNQSSGEWKFNAISTHFQTWYSNGVEVMRTQPNSHKTLSIGSTSENAALYVAQVVLTSSWLPALRIDPGAHTSMTASTSFNGSFSKVSAATQTWATGSLSSQAFNYFDAPTIAFAGTSTATDVFNVYYKDPVAGTNATITNKWSLGTEGAIKVGGLVNSTALTFSNTSINTTAGDAATINASAGRFRKDTTGTTFTLTNSFITANSIIILTATSDLGTTGYDFSCVASSGSAVITFWTAGVAAAPSANQDVAFIVIN